MNLNNNSNTVFNYIKAFTKEDLPEIDDKQMIELNKAFALSQFATAEPLLKFRENPRLIGFLILGLMDRLERAGLQPIDVGLYFDFFENKGKVSYSPSYRLINALAKTAPVKPLSYYDTMEYAGNFTEELKRQFEKYKQYFGQYKDITDKDLLFGYAVKEKTSGDFDKLNGLIGLWFVARPTEKKTATGYSVIYGLHLNGEKMCNGMNYLRSEGAKHAHDYGDLKSALVKMRVKPQKILFREILYKDRCALEGLNTEEEVFEEEAPTATKVQEGGLKALAAIHNSNNSIITEETKNV